MESDTERLLRRFEQRTEHVDGIRDIAPESPEGTFTAIPEEASMFAGEQTVEFMDYGVDVMLTFDEVNEAYILDTAVSFEHIHEEIDERRETLDITEHREDVPQRENYWAAIRAGDNHEYTGEEYALYPGDTVVFNPFPRDWLFASFTGFSENERALLGDVFVQEGTHVSDDVTDPSGVAVASETGLLEPTLTVVDWVQSFCTDRFDWGTETVGVSMWETQVYRDGTRLHVRL